MSDYEIVAQAIRYVAAHYREQPSLAEVAASVGLSEYHLQRVFARWAGISPKRLVQYLTAQLARDLLQERRAVLDVAQDVGLSGPGRLHDLTVRVHAMTPGEVARQGAGLTLRYGLQESPFGACLIALTERGVCALAFREGEGDDPLAALRAEWPGATLREDLPATAAARDCIFGPPGHRTAPGDAGLSVLVKGTNFQVRVWEALLRVPPGRVTTYGALAAEVGLPRASRAVGSAVGANPIAYLIPCHRVLQSTGALGGYRYGPVRKQAMLAWESAWAEASEG